jgi:hypothetical protein
VSQPVNVDNPYFKILLWIVTGINFAALFFLAAVAFWGKEPPNKAQEALVEVSRYGFTTTLGALVGLLCGRATPDYVGPLPKQKKEKPR